MKGRSSAALLAVALLAALASVPGAAAEPRASRGRWLAGDLHVHTYWSHDVCATPVTRLDGSPCDEPWTWGFSPGEQIANAEQRGLDFVAITDHNTVDHQRDPGYRSDELILVPGYEHSLRGHAQLLGARRVYPEGDESAEAVGAMIEAIHADGGVFQVNHPMESAWRYGEDVSDFDTVEVWNIFWPYQQELTGDELNPPDNPQAVEFWEAWLDRGKRAGATGGSDNHWRATSVIQGVGQPTTWVFARTPSVRGILEGLRKGRTFVSAEPPSLDGPRAFLEADRNRDGTYESMVGSVVPRFARFRVRVEDAPGHVLRVVGTGGRTLEEVPVESSAFVHELAVPPGTTWVRAEVFLEDGAEAREGACLSGTLPGDDQPRCFEDRYWMAALTSPIYLRTSR